MSNIMIAKLYTEGYNLQDVLGSFDASKFIMLRLLEANKIESMEEIRDTIMNVYGTYHLPVPQAISRVICGETENYNQTVKEYVFAFVMGLYGEEPKKNAI
ncbi:hypothetical protein AB1K84_23605 [Mesobacillus foraminis]|uniref:hypothetical protein n=1 Tax=Mesobacillus foraminis TaxID=279826 RepID=UPI0039A3B585